MVSGSTIDVSDVNAAAMLQNAIMIFQARPRIGYDLVALRNIERLEQLPFAE
jgi:hypothetical protein